MSKNVRVNINEAHIKSRMATANKQARMILKNEIVKDTRPYVPMKTATLANSANHSIGSNDDKIVYRGPQARFLYYGKVMVGKTSGKTWANKGETKVVTNRNLTYQRGGSKWFERAKKIHVTKWLTMVKKVFK